MNVLDLFSGIGGFSLGLERAGMRTVAFCEIEPYCRAVLRKHWPGVPVFPDVRMLTGSRLRAFDIEPDVICGGFPCQDISLAGKGAGLAGERSGLWFEYHRLISEIRPRWVIIENVAALRSRGLDQVLGSLAAIGYDAEWYCIPASAVGAPHRRDRVWIVAHSRCERGAVRGEAGDVAGATRAGEANSAERQRDGHAADDRGATVAHADHPRLEGWLRRELQERAGQFAAGAGGPQVPDANDTLQPDVPFDDGSGVGVPKPARRWGHTWLVEPDVGRVADGVPARVDRLRALGNAVVPQIPEIIGRAIMAATYLRPDLSAGLATG